MLSDSVTFVVVAAAAAVVVILFLAVSVFHAWISLPFPPSLTPPHLRLLMSLDALISRL